MTKLSHREDQVQILDRIQRIHEMRLAARQADLEEKTVAIEKQE